MRFATPYIARFVPQAWQDSYAVTVDPQGPTEWDCSAALGALEPRYRAELLAKVAADGEALDVHDGLLCDQNAPEWVRNWRGPFDIYVRASRLRRAR